MGQCRNPCAVCKQLFGGSSREAVVELCCVRGEARPGEAQPCAELQLCGGWWHSSGGSQEQRLRSSAVLGVSTACTGKGAGVWK